jgi:hypothetical protein
VENPGPVLGRNRPVPLREFTCPKNNCYRSSASTNQSDLTSGPRSVAGVESVNSTQINQLNQLNQLIMSHPPITTHILKLSCGVTVTATLQEVDGTWSCIWDKPRPWSQTLLDKVKMEYLPWRNQIFRQWCERNGKRLLVIDC